MKILLICKRRYTNRDLITEKFGRLFHFPHGFATAGDTVCVLAADYAGERCEEYSLDGMQIFSVPLRIQRLLSYFKTIISLTWRFSPDVIVGSGDSHFGYIALWLARLSGAKFIFDVYDPYYSFGSNKIPGLKILFWRAIKSADMVLCANKNLQKILQQYNSKVEFFPNGVDLELFKPRSKQACREKYDIDKDTKVIGYFGSMEEMRGIADLVKACELRYQNIPVKLLLAGKGFKKEYERPFVDYRGDIPQAVVAELIAACDVVCLPYRRTLQIDFGNSCKTAEYLASQVPIVTTDADNFLLNYPALADSDDLAVCRAGDASALADAIIWQLEHRRVVQQKVYESWDDLGCRLKAAVDTLMKAK